MFSSTKLVSYLCCAVLTVAATLVSDATAQTHEVTGIVFDQEGLELRGATVVVMASADSTLIGFGTTRKSGEFQLKRIPLGKHILQISFVGFQTHSQPVTVDADVNVGRIDLAELVTELGELVITEDRIPIIVKADTVVYDASAFKVAAYATVEDLLKRLPGIEVDRDGTITAQGEEVKKILVDGKEFFGDDPKIATKNLQAESVKKVAVYDKKSDIAEFTGVDDGEEQKTIDLELKDEFRRGYFGSVSGAYGMDNHYDGQANVNRFSPSTQLAFLGNASDVAGAGFSSTNFDFGGRGSNRVGGLDQVRGVSGLTTAFSGGLNFAHDFSKNTKIRSSYFNNYTDELVDSDVLQQQLVGNSLGALTVQNGNDDSQTLNHRLNLDVERDFNPTNTVRVRIRGQATGADALDIVSSDVSGRDNVTQSATRDDSNVDRLGGNASATYMHRFGESARNIVLDLNANLDDSQLESDFISTTEFFTSGNLVTSEEVSQLKSNLANDVGLRAQVSYTEPLGGIKFFELRLQRRQTYEDETQSVYDRVAGDLIFNDSLSSGYDRTYSYNQARALLRWDGKEKDLSFGLSIQQSQLDGQIVNFGVPIEKSYVHLLPTASYRANLSRGRHIAIRYSADTREPTIRELQPLVDNTNPLNVFVGNPELNPEYTHSVRGTFRWFDQFTFMSVFASLRASYTKNQIVQARTVDDRFLQTISPVNIDGDWTVSSTQNFGSPIRSLGIQLNLSNNATYGRSTEFVNTNENDTQTVRDAVKLSLDNRNKEKFEIVAGGTLTFNVNRYSLNKELNQSYVNRTLFGELALTPTPAWRFSTGLDATLYSKEVFGESQNVVMWNAEVSRSVMANNRAQIVILARDLLNQSVGIDYTNSAGFVREQQVRSVGRYVLLKFVYNLSTNGGGGRGFGRTRF